MSSSTTNSCITKGIGCSSPTHLPEFIDTSACLCGLLDSKSTLTNNGQQIEYWRCIGDATGDVTHGGTGKWYNTSLPSQELSGIAQPQDWAENPPDTSQAYVLVDTNGKAAYEKLGSGGSPELTGADADCTGKNDTTLSGMYYAKGKQAPKSASSASSVSSTSSASSASSKTTVGSTATSASGTTSSIAAPTASTTSAGPSSSTSPAAPAGSSSSAATHVSLKSTLLIGMVLAPLVSFLM